LRGDPRRPMLVTPDLQRRGPCKVQDPATNYLGANANANFLQLQSIFDFFVRTVCIERGHLSLLLKRSLFVGWRSSKICSFELVNRGTTRSRDFGIVKVDG
jgi:hypothetical protein